MLPNVALSLWFISTKLKKKYCSNQNPTTFHTEYIRNIRNIRIYASSMKCIIQLLLFMSAFSHMEIINSARLFISLTVRFSKLSFSGYFPLFYQFQFKSWLESGWWEAQSTSVVLVTFIGSSLCIAAPDGSRKKKPLSRTPPSPPPAQAVFALHSSQNFTLHCSFILQAEHNSSRRWRGKW